jgi:parallel beta-helix repeat protein
MNLNHCTLGLFLYECESTTISDSDFNYNSHSGIKILSSNYTTITNVTVTNNGNGITFETCDIITVTGSTLTENGAGIYGGNADGFPIISAGTRALINDNLITYNRNSGIYVLEGHGFEISDNQIERNWNHGIYFAYSSFNNISGNINRYNTIAGIYLHQSSNNAISDNTASYNADFGIKLADASNDNNITKNTLNTNYNTTISYDFIAKGIEIHGCADNVVSENTIRNHGVSINIELSNNIIFTENTLDEGINLQHSDNLIISKNLLDCPAFEIDSIYIYSTSGCMFIENVLKWAGFRITYGSNNNTFIGNVISDCAAAFNFIDSSYNKVINNSIYRASQCFKESGNCIGNVFIGNTCQEGIETPFHMLGAIIGSIAVAVVAVFMYLKRRKYMRK